MNSLTQQTTKLALIFSFSATATELISIWIEMVFLELHANLSYENKKQNAQSQHCEDAPE